MSKSAKKALPEGLRWRDGLLHIDYIHEGKRFRRSTKTADVQLAEIKLAELKSALFYGRSIEGVVEAEGMTLSKAFEAAFKAGWLLDKKQSSIDDAHKLFRALTSVDNKDGTALMVASTPIKKVDKVMLVGLQQKLRKAGRSNSTINHYMWLLKACLEGAVEAKALDGLPRMPKRLSTQNNRRKRYLTYQEEQLILQFTGSDDRYKDLRDVWVILLETGMRLGEATKIHRDDIDWREGKIKVQWKTAKNSHERRVSMEPAVAAVIKRRLGDKGELVFERPKASRDPKYWIYHLNKLWEECRTELKLPDVVMHTARHTVGTKLTGAGATIPAVQEFLGQLTPSMALRYSQDVTDQLKTSAGLLASFREREKDEAQNPSQTRHENGEN